MENKENPHGLSDAACVQIARIMLMCYRQGWVDASVEFTVIASQKAAQYKEEYDKLAGVSDVHKSGRRR